MTLNQPVWLVLAIPLAAALWHWRLPSRLLQALRCLVVALVVLAMCGPAVRLSSRAGTVVVVADRSLSMPPGSEQSHIEAVDLVQAKRGSRDRLAVVSFGRNVVVELSPQAGRFAGFVGEIDREGSNLAEALQAAVSLIPEDTPGRILVLSDGRFTGTDPLASASRAAARDIAVDYRAVTREPTNDLAILRVDAPSTVQPQESFMITVWVRSPVPQLVRYELRRGGALVASGTRTTESGITRLVFRDRAAKGGTSQYALEVVGEGSDPVPENNRARLLVGVLGPKPLLCVARSADSGLARLLSAGGMNMTVKTPDACRWELEDLSQYAAVLIENTPAGDVGEAAMENIAAWVRETGAGLMMTGGKQAYGPGGYFRSPLEPVMPVSMELRKEHRKLALAIVVALDRSGSMAISIPGGKTKMDLANLASVEVVNLLSGMDEFGCVAVDSSAHVIVPLAPLTDKQGATAKIRRIQSMGGGIFIYEALSTAARMLLPAQAGTRHIILFADAADSEEPGAYKKLLEECQKAGVTVSVIGLGTPGDCDAELLRDIAKRGNGRCFFTNRPQELPRLFAQDTFVVARSAFLEETTPVRTTGGMVVVSQNPLGDMPPIGGYNLCYLRPGANLAAVTVDEYKAPFVAAWYTGAGRALCYTGEADGEYTGPIAAWQDVGHFFTSLARWTAGEANRLPGDMLLRQQVGDDVCTVALHLDPERQALPFTAVPTVTTLRGLPGRPPETSRAEMAWTSTDTLAVSVPVGGQETVLSSVEIPGIGRFTLPPVCLPYSAEFKPAEPGEGLRLLERLGRVTGGTERINLAAIWDELPAKPRLVSLAPWLLLAAIVLFLLEVLERRTWLLSISSVRTAKRKAGAPAQPTEGRPARPRAQPSGPEAPKPSATEPAPKKKAAALEVRPDIGDALRKAHRRAKGRTDRPKS
ncbi:MAG: vWA domain-containing protein [Phycisphaerae bacterium]